MSIILAFLAGEACAPIIWLFIVLMIIKAFFDDFWGTIETIFHGIVWVLALIWQFISWVFMFVWDSSFFGPVLAIAGAIAVLYYFRGVFIGIGHMLYSLLKLLGWISVIPILIIWLICAPTYDYLKKKSAENQPPKDGDESPAQAEQPEPTNENTLPPANSCQ